uniref:NADH-ubiquinone oxidoreductase chain 4L n=1 Tax=Haedus sp. TaxID=2931292 RepID=A0A8T9ZXR4_9HEMI|nr:NADH dehydrogenase subunit 4L [Haedus sp.]
MLLSTIFFSFLSGIMVMLSMRKHLLLTLLGMEFTMLSLFIFMFYTFCFGSSDMCFLLYFLVMLVCEGALGISIMVTLIRTHGNDLIMSLYMMSW